MKQIYRSAILDVNYDSLDETIRCLGDYLPMLVMTELIIHHKVSITLAFNEQATELTIAISLTKEETHEQ